MTHLDLPEPIRAYFDADKHGSKAVASCFTKHGVVRDEGQTYSGLAAIQTWKEAASAKYSYATTPFAVEQENGRHMVSTRLTGNFPGSPVDLRFVFRLERGKIASLEIAP